VTVTVWAPGRVNLIGDHTDYMGGLVLPMAVQLGTTITAEPDRTDRLVLRSDRLDGTVDVALPVLDAASVEPSWGRYAAGVAQELGAVRGLDGVVRSDLPIGGGLSSSASLEVAVALALGATGSPLQIARLCQRAEVAATGVPCGIMDQLAVTAGIDGHALLIDCATDEVTPVRVPERAAVWVLDSGEPRELAASGYASRRAQAEAAAAIVGPLPHASMADIGAIDDPVLRARARHVRSECDRVRAFAAAVAADDLVRAGQLMTESHRSLRDDYEVSTTALDELVERLAATPGVHGARLTGAGFGGCAVALADRGVPLEGIRVRPTVGATVFWD
jgi:galactokinase